MQKSSRPFRHSIRTESRNVKYPGGQKQVNSQKNEDETTVAYVKRVLCRKPLDSDERTGSAPDHDADTRPLDELLPPLTSSNTIDVELYALIAVILDNFVHSWYSRITPDIDFTNEIIRIVAHCTRGIEQRLHHVNLEALLLDELPELALKHVEAVRNARKPCNGMDSRLDQRSRFHILQPRMALHPPPADTVTAAIQRKNEDAWCLLLVHRVLPLVLPPEDLQNPCLKVLVSEVLAEVVFRGGIVGKASEGWLWWEGITNIIQLVSRLRETSDPDISIAVSSTDRLGQYGLLSSSSSPPSPKTLEAEDLHDGQRGRFDAATTMFWAFIQFATLVWLFLRSSAIVLVQAQSLPNRTNRFQGRVVEGEMEQPLAGFGEAPPAAHDTTDDHDLRPIIDMRIWACISRIVELDERMPWLSGFTSLVQWMLLVGPGQLCCANSRLDRFLSSALHEHVLTNATLIPNILRAARSALFPPISIHGNISIDTGTGNNNSSSNSGSSSIGIGISGGGGGGNSSPSGSANVPPLSTAPLRAPNQRQQPLSEDEIARIRNDCARTIVDAIPDAVRRRFFATPDTAVMRADVAANCLDLFADSYVNEHLVVGLVELLAVRLFPELLLSDEDGIS